MNEKIKTQPIARKRIPIWISAIRHLAIRSPNLPGLYSLLRLIHHPDRRQKFYFKAALRRNPAEPIYSLETRYFTDWQVFFFGTQDQLLEKWINQNVKPDWTCIDIGANFGFFTIQMAKRASCCIAFEPIPRFADRVEENLQLNELKNGRVVRSALGDQNGDGKLYIPPEGFANWGASGLIRPQGGAMLNVKIQRLDDFIAHENVTRVDMLKIDVEGAEDQVLNGSFELLRRFHPYIIFENNHESGLVVQQTLKQEGYKLMTLDSADITEEYDFAAGVDVVAEYSP